MRNSKRIIFVFISAILLFSITTKEVNGQVSTVSTVSGSFDLTLSNYAGTGQYTIQYRYPSTVSIGQNLTISVTVFVDQLSELKLYVYTWGLVATLSAPNGHPITNQALSPGGFFLYQGSHWGPNNIVIPITGSNFNASTYPFTTSLVLQWIADVWYDKPYNYHFPENGEMVAGNVTIVNSTQTSGNTNYYYLAAVGGIIVIGVAVVWIISRSRSNKKHSITNDAPASQLGK